MEVQNHLSIGDVNISLEELTRAGTTYGESERIVLPSETISKIPRITNLAMPCYVRVKVALDQSEITSHSEVECDINTAIWILQGEYYYYRKPLEEGESIDLFREVKIPSDWTETEAEKRFLLNITAEAIQSANFTPDFDSSDPWGSYEPEVCIHKSGESVTINRNYQNLNVELKEDASELVALPEDFFANFGLLMPGDLVSDTVRIQNPSKTETELFFSTKAGENSGDLSQKIQLIIELDGKQVYQGSLRSAELQQEISLGVFEPGCDKSMKFILLVPEDMKNEYAMAQTDEKWIFSARFEELPSKVFGPVTGDGQNVVLWLLTAVGAVFLFAVLGEKGNRKRRK
ncbi:MAG: hypothetical protein ACI4EG_13480 [Fusicatenibacter sp.]|nr:hypothetical protein [Fusicatenibacter sp.]